ncbi:Frataxin, mitochondrial [Zancudomyces culisetae]|uniref:Frataxin, mitochondrial n=1 Tax=Zancudomyces culisetae TaxID=1213189 RepID=A0A1R1PW49_ZANCU|nr:Frataxin, mitochondrial [Zancudomyces culisetae]|eukprot:OMH85205.1 Frataxin, mitochondrial [Zancudomyces culisetae]
MGVLNINMGDMGSYVLNQQPPNQQIWFSSPISGPKRFEYNEASKNWIGTKDGKVLEEILKEEIFSLAGIDIEFQ